MVDKTLQRNAAAYRLAALDAEFIRGDSMRGVHLLLEYSKAEERLRSWGIHSTVVVFGSALFVTVDLPMRGQRHIAGGRKKVRRVLYMAALRCVRVNTILKAFYQRMLSRGKPFKVAITAVMRKLLCVLNLLIANPNFQLAR